MQTSPSHTDAAKPRLRGDMYLRAEERHRAELAAAELTEILTPAVPDVFTTTSTVAESLDAPAPLLPDPARAPDAAPPAIDAAPAIEPPWVSEVPLPVVSPPAASRPVAKPPVANLPSAALPSASAPAAIQPVRVTDAGHARAARALVPGAALATIAIASLFGIAASLWPPARTDQPANPPAATHAPAQAATSTPAAAVPAPKPLAAAASAAAAPVVAAPLATATASPVNGSSIPASPPLTNQLTAATRQQGIQPDAPAAVTAVRTASEGQLRIVSTPPGARVTVNGIGWGQTPLTVGHLPLGTKKVRLSRDGYASQERIVELRSSDASAALNVTLPRTSAARP